MRVETSAAQSVGREAGRSRSSALTQAGFRSLLDEVLSNVEEDARTAEILQATGLRIRFRFPDLGLSLQVVSSDAPGRHLEWSFAADPAFQPELELEMDSEVANGYLQGRESLAIAIARGRVRCSGASRVALAYLPAIRLLVEPYRNVITSEHPSLVV